MSTNHAATYQSGNFDVLSFSNSLQSVQPSVIKMVVDRVNPPHISIHGDGDVNVTLVLYGVSDRNLPSRNIFVRWGSNRNAVPTFDDYDPNIERPPSAYRFDDGISPAAPSGLQSTIVFSHQRRVVPGDKFIVGIIPRDYQGVSLQTFQNSMLLISFVQRGN